MWPIIATPHNFHLAHMELYAAHHKHILCEKPIVVNEAEATRLLQLSERYKIFIMEAYWSIFVPAFAKFQELFSLRGSDRWDFLRSEIGFSHPGDRGLAQGRSRPCWRCPAGCWCVQPDDRSGSVLDMDSKLPMSTPSRMNKALMCSMLSL